MAVANKFVRGLEGNMRLRVNNKPIPDYGRGFRNPVPPPKPGGGGIITKIIKVGGKFLAVPFIVVLDFFGNQKGFSSGNLPAWIKDIEAKEIINAGQYDPLVEVQASSDKFHIFGRFTSMNSSGGGCNVTSFWRTSLALQGNEIASLNPVILANNSVAIRLTNGSYQDLIERNNDSGTDLGDLNSYGGIFNRLPQFGCLNQTGTSAGHTFKQTKVARQNRIPLDPTYPGSTSGVITTSDDYFATARALVDQLTATDWKFSGFTKLPTIKPGKITPIPDFFKLPEITKKPAVIPTEIPQPIPDYDPDEIPDFDIFPDPEPVFVPTPRPKIIPEPIINPDPQPDVNPTPDINPKPEPKWRKITTYLQNGEYPEILKPKPKPPIVLDKTPIPFPIPEPVKLPPPIQTPIDKCVDHCGGGGGTIDFNLPDDSELAELLKAIKKKVDEIEQSVNQTLEGEIEVGSCEIPQDKNNETDELVYEPDPAKTITYSDKGLKAINLALSGVQTKLTSLHEEFCQPKDIPSSIPEWWQVRAGSDRPQLVVIFQGGNSKWSMALPWYKGKFKEKIINLIPAYDRGNFSTILTLNDNSKIVVNASSKDEGERFIKRIQAVIKPKLLEQAELKSGGERKGKPLKTGKVIPVYAKYFATGQQNLLPDWRYNFKTQKFIKYAKPDTQ